MERHERHIGIEDIANYLYHIGIDDENKQDLWIQNNINYKPYSLSDESSLFLYNYFDEYLDGFFIDKNLTDAGLECLMWAVERNRPVSSGYQIPY